jgi:hypothetical protein
MPVLAVSLFCDALRRAIRLRMRSYAFPAIPLMYASIGSKRWSFTRELRAAAIMPRAPPLHSSSLDSRSGVVLPYTVPNPFPGQPPLP